MVGTEQASTTEGTGPAVRSAWRVAGALATVALLALGVLSAVAALSHKTEHRHASFPGGSVRSLDIRSFGGSIRLIGVEGSETTVDAVVDLGLERAVGSQQLQDGRLVIRGDSCQLLGGILCSVDYTIRVPRGVDVTATSGGGDIAVSDVKSSVDLSSSGGDIGIGGATVERLSARSSGGDVRARGLVGATFDADSSGGDVGLSFVAPPERVTGRSSGGSVVIEVPNTADAYRVQTSSSHGDVTTAIRTDPASPRLLRASSSGGSVSIRYGD
jgi:hypothetical protein